MNSKVCPHPSPLPKGEGTRDLAPFSLGRRAGDEGNSSFYSATPNQLQELLEDTYVAVGSEAYSSALTVYKYAKASDQGAGLEGIVEELGQRFIQRTKKEKLQPVKV
jgi:hypothetical protein